MSSFSAEALPQIPQETKKMPSMPSIPDQPPPQMPDDGMWCCVCGVVRIVIIWCGHGECVMCVTTDLLLLSEPIIFHSPTSNGCPSPSSTG